jgi:hypothetical protein
MNVQRVWIILSCLWGVSFGVATSYSVRREFDKAGEMSQQRISIKRAGILTVPCSVHGALAFDFAEGSGLCGYNIRKFREQRPQYGSLNEDRLLDHLCEEAGVNITSPFHPWRKVMKMAGIAAGLPLVALVLGWGLLWAYAGPRSEPLRA